jgi:hypothetical protein
MTTKLTETEAENLAGESHVQTPGGSREIHNPIYRRDTRGDPYKPIHEQPLSYRIWVALSVFRRDDLKYAVKVGFGAILYAMWSFIQPTRELYGHWRGEWGLLSYMLVCSMVCIYKLSTFWNSTDNLIRRLAHLILQGFNDSPEHVLALYLQSQRGLQPMITPSYWASLDGSYHCSVFTSL